MIDSGLKKEEKTHAMPCVASRRCSPPFALGAADPKPEILVFGAASLTESLQDLGKAYEAKTGPKVVFSFGSSSDLARQIQAGAPADVFFSADTAKMDALEKAGLVPRRADRREFLSNSLVVVVAARTRRLKIATAEDLADLPKIALADPASVPAGVYAKKWLTGARPLGQDRAEGRPDARRPGGPGGGRERRDPGGGRLPHRRRRREVRARRLRGRERARDPLLGRAGRRPRRIPRPRRPSSRSWPDRTDAADFTKRGFLVRDAK